MAYSTLSQVYSAGLSDERRVVNFLQDTFQTSVVRPASKEQNILKDIDCFVDEKAVSIKAQHAGARYGNIYFELAQEPRGCDSPKLNSKKDISVNQLQELLDIGWVPSWYHTTEADLYCILQGQTLRIYQKSDIVDYVTSSGFLRIRPLSDYRRGYLLESKTYRYTNAVCGYINITDVRHCQMNLPSVNNLN